MLKTLINIPKIQLEFCRQFGKHNKKYIYKDGEQFGQINYYPRQPNHQDEDIEPPAKLFRVERIKPIKGNPYWEKRILKLLGIGDAGRTKSIVKNIPETNAMLWKVKHLINVVPIMFPYGEPTENDLNHTFLKENGDCIVTKEIKIDETRLIAAEEFRHDKKRIDGELLRKDSRLKWLNHW